MDYLSGWCRSSRRLDGHTAVVTGCNTGIGKETALDFYRRGARVIMACRDTEKAKIAQTEIQKQCFSPNDNLGNLIIAKLDLASLRSVKEFVEDILKSESKIHILVNNAGVMMCPRGETEDGFERHMGTNHLGHALLTLLLLPRMRSSAPARIVCVSSKVHQSYCVDIGDLNFNKKSYDPFEAYCRSKSANILFARELARRLKEHSITDVTAYNLHPGIVHTDIGRHFSETAWYGATWLWHHGASWFLKSPQCGAQTNIYCAVHEACSSESGLYYSDCAVAESSKATQDDEAAARLWEATVDMLDLRDFDPFSASST